jgi:hypothetical protein
MNIVYHAHAYFIARSDHSLIIFDSNSHATINTIVSADISGLRDITFLCDGQIRMVTSNYNDPILFFNQTDSVLLDYKLFYKKKHILFKAI